MAICPTCPAALAPGLPFCEACGVRVVYGADGAPVPSPPKMERGAVLRAWDFRAVPPPGCASRTMSWAGKAALDAHESGVLCTGVAASTAIHRDATVRLRDGCVRLTYTVLDAGARVGLALRYEPIGTSAITYVFDVSPTTSVAFIARLLIANDRTIMGIQTVLNTVRIAAGPPSPQRREIELRAVGGWLVGYLDGRPVVSAYDPAYGIGQLGIRVGREPVAPGPHTRVLLHEASVHWSGS